MHIILGALGVIVTILILVNRLTENGIDIGWLNPFAWKRRREWAKKYHANPIYSLSNPMEVTALIMVALAKSEGEMSADQKREIKEQFKAVFHLDEERSSGLLSASVFLLKDDVEAVKNMRKLLAPSIEHFSADQASSALELMTHIANLDSPANTFQKTIIEDFKSAFSVKAPVSGEWA
jgi:hypothetical protein